MFEIVLYQPEIPANAGNIVRLCANTGCRLHLVGPLGFSLQNKHLKRAGLDYHDLAQVVTHESWTACKSCLSGRRLFAITALGERRYTGIRYNQSDVLVFGSETAGIPAFVLHEFDPPDRVRIPMANATRSLNLANAVAVVAYEAWRQLHFPGGG